jgi:Ca-activated chloride channel homolog
VSSGIQSLKSRKVRLLILWVAAVVSAVAQTASNEEKDTPTFKVNVKLVSLYATVTDTNGAPVTNLQKQDFMVYEDGNPEKVAIFEQESERPLSILLALDTSGSVRKDIKLELQSARRFVASILRPVDVLSLYQFNEVVSEIVPFTASVDRISKGIGRIRLGAGTALYDAIYLGGKALARRDGRKVMVLISDGGDTLSSTDYHSALRTAQQSEAIVYSIIMVPVVANAGRELGGEHALIQLANDTGGKYYYADSPAGLEKAFQQISNELRLQYLIGYYPSRTKAGSDFRRVEIKVNRPELAAHHRTGYYTSKIE